MSELEDLVERVDDHESRITQVESQVEGLGGRVNSLEQWLPILIQDNKDTLRMVNEQYSRMDSKIDKTLERQEGIVKDASTRVPKWAMWLFGTLTGLLILALLGVGGWIVETMIYRMH